MGLVKKSKKAKETTIDAEYRVLPEGEEPKKGAPEATRVDPEPLGSHNTSGNADARAAFVQEEGGESMPPESNAGAPKQSSGESNATEAIPEMSIEQIAAIAATCVNAAGSFVGPAVTKRSGDFWELTPKEEQSVEKAFVPVLKEALQDTKVTPFQVLIGVILAAYVPRTLVAYSQPKDGAKKEEEKPQEIPKPQPDAVQQSTAQVETPKEPEPVQVKPNGQKDYGWGP